VPDEVRPVAEQVGDEACVGLEVDPLDQGTRWKAGTVDHDELPAFAERLLRAPGRPAAAHAAVHEDDALHAAILTVKQSRRFFAQPSHYALSQALLCWRRMEPAPRPTFSLAGAGMTLIGSTAAVIVVGALVGWALGSVAWGFLVGAIVGIPAGVATVISRYGKAM
jgi:hypothetical protein